MKVSLVNIPSCPICKVVINEAVVVNPLQPNGENDPENFFGEKETWEERLMCSEGMFRHFIVGNEQRLALLTGLTIPKKDKSNEKSNQSHKPGDTY